MGARLSHLLATVFLGFCVLGAPASAAQTDYARSVDTVLRVTTPRGACGTGTVVGEDDEFYYATSNHHVTHGKGSNVFVEAWRHGRRFGKYKCSVMRSRFRRGFDVDMSLIKIPKDKIQIPLQIAPMAERDSLKKGDPVYTIGCPGCRWPSLQRGRVARVSGSTIYYSPMPIGGRSGSALFNTKGEVVGLVAWARKSENVGIAMSAGKVWDYLIDEVQSTSSDQDQLLPEDAVEVQDNQLPPDAEQIPLVFSQVPYLTDQDVQCPDGQCPDDGSFRDKFRRRPSPDDTYDPDDDNIIPRLPNIEEPSNLLKDLMRREDERDRLLQDRFEKYRKQREEREKNLEDRLDKIRDGAETKRKQVQETLADTQQRLDDTVASVRELSRITTVGLFSGVAGVAMSVFSLLMQFIVPWLRGRAEKNAEERAVEMAPQAKRRLGL